MVAIVFLNRTLLVYMVTSNFNLPRLITFDRTKMLVPFGTCTPNHLRPVPSSNTLETISTVGYRELGFVKWAVGCILHCFHWSKCGTRPRHDRGMDFYF